MKWKRVSRVEPEWWQAFIRQTPLGWNSKFVTQVEQILKNGLHPSPPGAGFGREDGSSSRLNCVYVSLDQDNSDYIEPEKLRYPFIQIDLTALDPELIVLDDDAFVDAFGRAFTKGPDMSAFNQLQGASPAEGPEMFAELDEPQWVQKYIGLDKTFAYKSPIPPAALSLNPRYEDLYRQWQQEQAQKRLSAFKRQWIEEDARSFRQGSQQRRSPFIAREGREGYTQESEVLDEDRRDAQAGIPRGTRSPRGQAVDRGSAGIARARTVDSALPRLSDSGASFGSEPVPQMWRRVRTGFGSDEASPSIDLARAAQQAQELASRDYSSIPRKSGPATMEALDWDDMGLHSTGHRLWGWTDPMGGYHTITTNDERHSSDEQRYDERRARRFALQCMSKPGSCSHGIDWRGDLDAASRSSADEPQEFQIGRQVDVGGLPFTVMDADGEHMVLLNHQTGTEQYYNPSTRKFEARWKRVSDDWEDRNAKAWEFMHALQEQLGQGQWRRESAWSGEVPLPSVLYHWTDERPNDRDSDVEKILREGFQPGVYLTATATHPVDNAAMFEMRAPIRIDVDTSYLDPALIGPDEGAYELEEGWQWELQEDGIGDISQVTPERSLQDMQNIYYAGPIPPEALSLGASGWYMRKATGSEDGS